MPAAFQARMRTLTLFCGFVFGLAVGGCSFGPRVLEKSYAPYYESLRHVDEEELLRSLVHLRYCEHPGALSVSSLLTQYELSGQAEARPFFVGPNPSNSNVFHTFSAILPDVTAGGANRPTITMIPGDDGEAVRRFLTPITAETLVFLMQTGWSPSTLLHLWAARLNGVPNINLFDSANCEDVVDPGRFNRAVELLESAGRRDLVSIHPLEYVVEVSGPLAPEAATASAAVDAAKAGLELRLRADGKAWALVRKERRLAIEITPGAEHDPELLESERLLNLVPAQSRYDLVVAPGRAPDPLLHPSPPSTELRINPRSTAQVYLFLTTGIQPPCEHITAGFVVPSSANSRETMANLFTVCTAKGHKPPRNAYIAVKYRGYWYYIDDHDTQSKRTFALMIQLSRLDLRRRPPGGGPLLSLPTGR